MTTRVPAIVIALIFAGATGADARPPGGGGGPGPGGPGPGASRPAPSGPGPSASRSAPSQGAGRPGPSAPVVRAAPAQSAPNSGFNLSHETGPMSAPQAAARPHAAVPSMMTSPSTRGDRQSSPGTYHQLSDGVRPPTSGGRPPATPAGGWHSHPSGFVVANPRYHGGPWGWNGGNQWVGYSNYWGDGFWGPFALGSLVGAYVANDQTQPYYQVAASTPGAQLLANYGLVQTPCGSADLVVLYGPDNGTICAYPNSNVAPGDYTIDESSLTITATSS